MPSPRSAHRPSALWCVVFIALAAFWTRPAEAIGSSLVTAANDEYVWFILDQADGPVILLHHDDFGGMYTQTLMSLQRMPEAAIAEGDRLWLIFPPDPETDMKRREVFSLRIDDIPGLDQFTTTPRDRLQVETALPGGGRLAGAMMTKFGPAVFLVPFQHQQTDVTTPDELDPSEQNTARDEDVNETEAGLLYEPQLLYLQGNTWLIFDLPTTFSVSDASHLITSGHRADTVFLLGGASLHEPWIAVHRTDKGWDRIATSMPTERVVATTTANGQSVAVWEDESSGRLNIETVRVKQVVRYGQVVAPTADWTAVGRPDAVWIVSASSRGELSVVSVDQESGETSSPVVMGPIPIKLADRLRMPAVLGIMLISVILLVVYKPGSVKPAELERGKAILLPSGRAQALLIDFIPGAVIACVALQTPPAALLGLPFSTALFEQSLSYLIMVGVTVVHTTISEIVWRTTLGKKLKYARVMSAEGIELTNAQILLRNLVKILMLIAPPLAIIALTNPNMQALHDLAARGVVVQMKPPQEEG